MLLPRVTRFSAPAALGRYAVCARTMGVAPPDADDAAAVDALLAALDLLNADLQVPSPRLYGVSHNRYFDSIEIMATQALESGSPANNPRIPTHAEICELYREAWD
jgi:alcohol dehydrogenase class IV